MSTPVPGRDTYLAQWSTLHGGYDLARGLWLVRAWLTVVYWVVRPLAARGVRPSAVTAGGPCSPPSRFPRPWLVAGGRCWGLW
ncbi:MULTISPECIES: hypothetical protein [unclassified Frankia]